MAVRVGSARRTAPARTETLTRRPDGGCTQGIYRGVQGYTPTRVPAFSCIWLFFWLNLAVFGFLGLYGLFSQVEFYLFKALASLQRRAYKSSALRILSWPSGHVR